MVARRRRPPQAHDLNDDWDEAALCIIQGIEKSLREPNHISESDAKVRALNALLKAYPRDRRGHFSKSQLIAVFRKYQGKGRFNISESAFFKYVQMRPIRTQSGVVPVTVFTKPHPCPGRCVFCPNDVRMPKSYLSDEPGAQRAEDNKFDPYLQTWNRLAAFRNIGHPVNKVELIVLGGTWSFYQLTYQVWFIARCFEALNDFGEGNDARDEALLEVATFGNFASVDDPGFPRALDGRNLGSGYNGWVKGRRSNDTELNVVRQRLQRSHFENEKADVVCVGLSVETRPDYVTETELIRLRELGCTKLQLGIQSTSDAVLVRVKRGHDVDASKRAVDLARRAGFKIQVHWMCNLVGATPEMDKRDYQQLFESPDFRPDELKIYPCSLVPSAELMGAYDRGEWAPYDHDSLVDVVASTLEHTPRYCRLSRVIRDIPSGDIVAGSTQSNLREVAEKLVRKRCGSLKDIRARQIHQIRSRKASNALELRGYVYATRSTQEHFLEYVTHKDKIAAFLRLSLPQQKSCIDEIAHSAMIREVHVYGGSLPIGERGEGALQHQGLGRALIERAQQIATEAGYTDLAVISAVGTRGYYRGLGFCDGPLYQHYALQTHPTT